MRAWSWKYSSVRKRLSDRRAPRARAAPGSVCAESPQATRGAQCTHLQHLGDPAAAGGVRLQHVDGAGLQHAAEIERVITVLRLAATSIPRRGAVSQQSESPRGHPEETGSSNHDTRASPRERLGERQRLLTRVSAIPRPRTTRPHRRSRCGHVERAQGSQVEPLSPPSSSPPPDSLCHPASELALHLLRGVGGEPAAAIHRHPLADPTQQSAQRDPKQPCLPGPRARHLRPRSRSRPPPDSRCCAPHDASLPTPPTAKAHPRQQPPRQGALRPARLPRPPRSYSQRRYVQLSGLPRLRSSSYPS